MLELLLKNMKRLLLFVVLMSVLSNCRKTNKVDTPPILDQEQRVVVDKDSIINMDWSDIKLNELHEGATPLQTKISDVDGILARYGNENSRTYKVTFMSNNNLNKNQIRLFRKNLEDSFEIQFDTNSVRKNHFYKYKDNLYFSYIEDSLDIDHYAFSFSMTDKELQNSNIE